MENDIYTPLSTKELTTVTSVVDDLLSRLEVKATLSIEEVDEILQLTLDTDEGGILIGYHGETLESLQLVLALIIARKIGRFVRVSIEVGDYKKNRQEYLEKLADQTRERVVTDQREVVLSELKSWERRIIHMLLKDDKEVESESLGEGKERVLVIRPRI